MDIIEGHPIPQDITGFQFKIIGDLTIKQFAYLALGLLLGWIFISLPLPGIIKIPLGGFFALTGIFLAFVPIQGRPADVMLGLFFKAVLHPNEYVYDKQSVSSLPTPTISVEPQPTTPSTEASTPDTTPSPEEITTLTAQLAEAKQEEQQQTDSPSAEKAHEKVKTLEEQLAQITEEKQQLAKQLETLQQQLEKKQEPVATPDPSSAPSTSVDKTTLPAPGMPLTPDAPNLVLGVVRDSRGNVLPNILIEVRDKSDNAVRAFKTNAQGKFASATPLLNGTYTIHFEDPKGQQQFETIEITADGSILQPFEVISTDERENLRKSLFGG